jgi:Protein of unknown function (DUF3551)
MKRLSSFRTIPLAALACAGFVLTMIPAAQAESKMEYYMSSPGSIHAGPFASMEQCQASASGISGHCYADPSATATASSKTSAPSNPSNAYAYAPKGHAHHRK